MTPELFALLCLADAIAIAFFGAGAYLLFRSRWWGI